MDVVVWQGFQQQWKVLSPRIAGLGSRVAVSAGRKILASGGLGADGGDASQTLWHRKLRLGGLQAFGAEGHVRVDDALVPDLHLGAPGVWHASHDVDVHLAGGLRPYDIPVLSGFEWTSTAQDGGAGGRNAVCPTRFSLALTRGTVEGGDAEALRLSVEVSHTDGDVDPARPARWTHDVRAWVQVLRPVPGTLEIARARRLRTGVRRLLASPSQGREPAGDATLTALSGFGFTLPVPPARGARHMLGLALCVQEKRGEPRRFEASVNVGERGGAQAWLDVVELCPVASGTLGDSVSASADKVPATV